MFLYHFSATAECSLMVFNHSSENGKESLHFERYSLRSETHLDVRRMFETPGGTAPNVPKSVQIHWGMPAQVLEPSLIR
jgi:hypothetical protein